ncbi:hypothetical protein [Sphingomonas qomolangmaensis]|uniref:Uncharacterized protein n=1 Tax=Sphingomonas qomolangmaensis TaxID=2918765 RepID=A0ABY5L6H4_9SPHN|nr:hypothetical protein [Sphingomonas qomolangmaensis]UUL81497.1 hypothetical protein NMP03_09760 [Sphingomonas qomolangmaensis]
MAKDKNRALVATPAYQRAEFSLTMPSGAAMSAGVEVTRGGILSIAVLVSAILLSSAVLVRAARVEERFADR